MLKMNFDEISNAQLKEIYQGYQSKIDILKKEIEDCQRKSSVIEEELHKRLRLEDIRRKMEEDTKDRISKILIDSKGKKKGESKKKDDDEIDFRKEQEKKWTIEEMKKMLDKKGVKYSHSLKKAEFIALIREHNCVREMNSLHKEKDK